MISFNLLNAIELFSNYFISNKKLKDFWCVHSNNFSMNRSKSSTKRLSFIACTIFVHDHDQSSMDTDRVKRLRTKWTPVFHIATVFSGSFCPKCRVLSYILNLFQRAQIVWKTIQRHFSARPNFQVKIIYSRLHFLLFFAEISINNK